MLNENGMIQQICFYPADDVESAFRKAEDKKSKQNEVDRLREFYRSMKFFYSFAQVTNCDPDLSGEEIEVLYAYARKGLEAEGKTA